MPPFTSRCISPQVRREEAFQVAWEELVRRYGNTVQVQVRKSLHHAGFPLEPEEVEERVQEVYCRLVMGGAGRLRQLREWSRAQVVAYLARVAQNVVVDELRTMAATKRGGHRTSFGGFLREVADRTADPGGNPEQQAIVAESRRLLLERCRLFAESMSWRKDRGLCLRVLRLALLEGWSSREIAQAEGGCLAPSTVDSLVHRARRRLAKGGIDVPSRRRRHRPLVSFSSR
jgi:DNA-directed RNA polymerase specialized sigma24 family protein